MADLQNTTPVKVLTPFEPGPDGFPHWLASTARPKFLRSPARRGSLGWNRKLSNEQVRTMRKLGAVGVSGRQLADIYQVDPSHVTRILRGERRANA